MCGRYRLSRRKQLICEYFDAADEIDWEPRYNIAPTQNIPVVTQDTVEPVRRASLMRWGLVPSWAKDVTVGARMINARGETAAKKPAFGELLLRRRCLIPADGFYEWSRVGKNKQPYCFEMVYRQLFAFAGLWDRWSAHDGPTLETCTILTTAPNHLLATIHDRMPVILPTSSYDLWLDPGFDKVSAVTDMLKPCNAGLMRRYPVSARVNKVANDDAACSEPTEMPEPIQAALF